MKLVIALLVAMSLTSLVLAQHSCESGSNGQERFSACFQVDPRDKDRVCHSGSLRDFGPIYEAWDWRTQGRVSAVKNQGCCGTCWIFAAVALLEGQVRGPIDLSEQQIIDCIGTTCDRGSHPREATKYVLNVGLMGEQDYPFARIPGQCRYNANKTMLKAVDFCSSGRYSVEELKVLVRKNGPVAVGINAKPEGIGSYKGGIFKCPNKLDVTHAVVIVGYNTTDVEPYWIIKNSWGPKWGESGYIRVAMKDSYNCGILQTVTIATVDLIAHQIEAVEQNASFIDPPPHQTTLVVHNTSFIVHNTTFVAGEQTDNTSNDTIWSLLAEIPDWKKRLLQLLFKTDSQSERLA